MGIRVSRVSSNGSLRSPFYEGGFPDCFRKTGKPCRLIGKAVRRGGLSAGRFCANTVFAPKSGSVRALVAARLSRIDFSSRIFLPIAPEGVDFES